jgi:hypothetical protein
MDSDSPAASRIAGQPMLASGSLFTANGNTFSSEFNTKSWFDGGFRRGGLSGLRPYRRLADGYGR